MSGAATRSLFSVYIVTCRCKSGPERTSGKTAPIETEKLHMAPGER